MGGTDTAAIDKLAGALKGQPKLNLTHDAANDAVKTVNALVDAYGILSLVDVDSTPPKAPILQGQFVEAKLKKDVQEARTKAAAMIKVLEAVGSSIDGVADAIERIARKKF